MGGAVFLPFLLLILLLRLGLAPRPVESVVPGPHISSLTVLLPPRLTNPVEYRLQGSGGCFSWSWDHHDILSVHPEYNRSRECSTSAKLISVAPYSGRKETSVYATDIWTGTVIRCEVFIDMISKIRIIHHSLKLDLDGLATLHVHAFDQEDNIFSSLVGLQFLWQLMPTSFETDGFHYLLHVPLKETPLSDCGGFCGDLETRIKLEDGGTGSDLYVVKGVGIGHEVVTTQLIEPQLEHVLDKIVLTVAEPMSVEPPSPVFVTIGALINFKLRVLRLNKSQVIDMPSPHHRWSVLNSSVAQVDSAMGISYALNLGITNIIVEDTRLSGHVQTSSLHVVIPAKMSLCLQPITDAVHLVEELKPTSSSVVWHVFPGQEYIILVKVLSQEPEAEEIYITENNDLKLESSTYEHWDLFSVTNDVAVAYGCQNCRFLKPLSMGHGILTATITYHHVNAETPEVLKGEQEIVVCSKVKIFIDGSDEHLQIIHLPWVPGVYQEVKLKVTGGCANTMDDYKWFSSNTEVISVSSSGFLRVNHPGQAVIRVVSVFDPINFDEVVVEASIPYSMVMLPYFPVEAAVGTHLQAAVTLRTSDGNDYYRCDAFSSHVKWNLVSGIESFKVINRTRNVWDSDMPPLKEDSKELYGSSCAWTLLYASGSGRAVLQATLSCMLPSYLHSDQPLILKATSSIAAYHPLLACEVGSGNQYGGYWVDLTKIHASFQDSYYSGLDKLFLVPGSGMDILLLGGPERWDERVEYIDSVEILGEQSQSVRDGILVEQTSTSRGKFYKVLCLALGNFKLLFSRGNLVGDDHRLPALANLELPVICSLPSFITLLINEPANTFEIIEAAVKADRGPGGVRSPVVVANGRSIRIAAVGIHATKRAFANSSSLCLNWELSGCKALAHWNDTDYLLNCETAWERFLALHNATGMCTVRATVTGFSESIAGCLLDKTSSLLKSTENILTDAVRLQLVSSLQVIPEFLLLVFDPKTKVNLSVTGGTCFLEAETNDTQVVQLIQHKESTECSYLTIGARGLGEALVTVHDVGLSPPATASALVKVANVEWIKIVSEDEISLMEGTTKTFTILAGADEGGIFDSSQYMYMNIHVHIDDGILNLLNKSSASRNGCWGISGSKFSVRATHAGITSLYVSAMQHSRYEIQSKRINVEVYKPLKIHPEYIYLCPGASYKLILDGGPKFGAFVKFDSENVETAAVESSSGRVSAISSGNTAILASVYGNGGTLLCQAYGQVQVGIPSAFLLNLPSDQLCVGCNMPIFPSFSEGNLFSFYGICEDYKWLVADDKVLSFQKSRHAPFSISETQAHLLLPEKDITGFINEVFGRSAGRTRISVSFSCNFMLSGTPHRVSYNASESVRVVSDPPLALGIPITWVLPPFYIASDLLPASSDPSGPLGSHNHGNIAYSVLNACGGSGLVKQDAIIVDGNDIATRESNNLACIQAKDRTTGRIEIASCVRVAEVAQVRLTTTWSSIKVLHVAVHTKAELLIRYTDHLGYTFHEAHGVVPLDAETNYPDIVSIAMPDAGDKKEHVILQANNPGCALVRVSIRHRPKAVDFILVSVGAQVLPNNPVLYVGQHLNFTIVGDGASGFATGRWLSTNRSILHIDRKSGEAHACGEGIVQVFFEDSNSTLETMVTVLKMHRMEVVAPVETLTNAPIPSKGISSIDTFKNLDNDSDALDYKLEANDNQSEEPYNCMVVPEFVGFTKPWIDHVTGSWYCLFFPHSPRHLFSSISNSEKSAGEGFLYISITASLKDAPHVSGSAHALFVAGFSIAGGRKLNLSSNDDRSPIIIVGNTDVEIHWNAKDLFSLLPVRRDASGIGGSVEYEAKVLTNQQFTDKVTIVLPATGQTEKIDVSYEPGERATSAGVRMTWVAILLCVVVLIVTIITFIWLLDRPSRTSPSTGGVPASSADRSNCTSLDNNESSPRTPGPLVQHVQRTIDRTPYYRQEGIRRFDPQYTY